MSWLTRWFPQSVPLTKPSARRFRPRFEALEDRLAPTAAPTLDSPSGAASPTTAFTWEPVAGVNYYNFQLVDQTTNQTLQGPNLTLTTITLGSPLRLGDTYEWLVQAVDTSGVASAWSTLTFSVTNLVAPTLIGPTGAAAPQPTFSWTATCRCHPLRHLGAKPGHQPNRSRSERARDFVGAHHPARAGQRLCLVGARHRRQWGRRTVEQFLGIHRSRAAGADLERTERDGADATDVQLEPRSGRRSL